jgi:hypothetical protein
VFLVKFGEVSPGGRHAVVGGPRLSSLVLRFDFSEASLVGRQAVVGGSPVLHRLLIVLDVAPNDKALSRSGARP